MANVKFSMDFKGPETKGVFYAKGDFLEVDDQDAVQLVDGGIAEIVQENGEPEPVGEGETEKQSKKKKK